MTKVKKTGAAPKPANSLRPRWELEPIDPRAAVAASMRPCDLLLSPEAQSAAVIKAFSSQFGEPEFTPLLAELTDKTDTVVQGDTQSIEAMLFAQATALQSMFANLARKAANQSDVKHLATILGLALKTQAQCRCTLEALAEVKNPRQVAFVRQQTNVAHGPQQVNNATTTPALASRTEKDANQKTELLAPPGGPLFDIERKLVAQGVAAHCMAAMDVETILERTT